MKKVFMTMALALAAMVLPSQAAQINGLFFFSQNNAVIGGPTAGSPLMFNVGANTLEFLTLNPVFEVGTRNGDFTLVAQDTPIVASSLILDGNNFNGFTFTFGGFTFTPDGYEGANLVNLFTPTNSNQQFYSVSLVGNYDYSGFDTTRGTFTISFQTPPTGGPWSASGSGEAIPEPSTYAMLGTALLGLGYLRRRK